MGNKVSNLVENEDIIKKFNDKAMEVAGVLLRRYPSVMDYMTAEDIVMESWRKILSQGISYNKDKGAGFGTFVWMIVSSVCLDCGRKVKRLQNIVSLDKVSVNEDNGDKVTLDYYLKDEDSYESYIECIDVINSCCRDFNGIDFKTICRKRCEGYSFREIAKEVGIRPKDIKIALSCMRGVVESRVSSDRTLADILYGDESILKDKRDDLKFTLSYVKDDCSGISLSDIVQMVIDGYSYCDIGKAFGISKDKVKGILDRYQTMGV